MDRQTGFSLVEVMITVFVLGFGLIGFAYLAFAGMAYNHDALARSQATLLAQDLLERMHSRSATPNGPLADAYTRVPTVAESGACQYATASAEHDRNCWYDAVRRLLPTGNARITVQDGEFVVEIVWVDRSVRRDAAIDSRQDCEDPDHHDRVWSDNDSFTWQPPSAAPDPAVCLQVQRWRWSS